MKKFKELKENDPLFLYHITYETKEIRLKEVSVAEIKPLIDGEYILSFTPFQEELGINTLCQVSSILLDKSYGIIDCRVIVSVIPLTEYQVIAYFFKSKNKKTRRYYNSSITPA